MYFIDPKYTIFILRIALSVYVNQKRILCLSWTILWCGTSIFSWPMPSRGRNITIKYDSTTIASLLFKPFLQYMHVSATWLFVFLPHFYPKIYCSPSSKRQQGANTHKKLKKNPPLFSGMQTSNIYIYIITRFFSRQTTHWKAASTVFLVSL